MQLKNDITDSHKYLHNLKHSQTGAFVEDYNMYEKKYLLD